MAGLNFRIETQPGLSAGLPVGLAGGVNPNQLHRCVSIAATSRSVSASPSNKSGAQTADNRMVRAPHAIRDIRAARSAAEFGQGLSAPSQMLASTWLHASESGRLKTDAGNVLDTVRTA